jgi:predicted Zn-dependent protease
MGDAGDIDGAVTAAGVAVEQFPLDVELRSLQAVLLLEAARPGEAAAAARAVLYLEPTLVMAHLTLARAQQALGDVGGAHRSLRNAGSLLRALAPDAVVPLSGGEPAGRLAAMVAAHLRATQATEGGLGPDGAR